MSVKLLVLCDQKFILSNCQKTTIKKMKQLENEYLLYGNGSLKREFFLSEANFFLCQKSTRIYLGSERSEFP